MRCRNTKQSKAKQKASYHQPSELSTLCLQGLGEREREVHDSKLIFQNIVVGAKSLLFSILFCTRSYVTAQAAEAAAAAAAAAGAPPPPAPSGQAAGVGMPDDDVATCTRLLTAGLACLRLPAYSGCAAQPHAAAVLYALLSWACGGHHWPSSCAIFCGSLLCCYSNPLLLKKMMHT